MAVKLHLFSGFKNEKLGITPDMELGHLYDDTNNLIMLNYAAERVGLKPQYLQNDNGIFHYDLWGNPLRWAKAIFQVVDDIEFAEDMVKIRGVLSPHPHHNIKGVLQFS